MSNDEGAIDLMNDSIKQTKDLINNLRNCNDQNQLPPDFIDLLNQLEENVKKAENIKKSIQNEKEFLRSNDTRADKSKAS